MPHPCSCVPPALHLRDLNPYVAAALPASLMTSIARAGPFGFPTVGGGDGRLAVGVSSFGAQGTNAHALVSNAEKVSDGGASSFGEVLADVTEGFDDKGMANWWRGDGGARTRYWVAPAMQVCIYAPTTTRDQEE